MSFSPPSLRQIQHFVTLVRLQNYARAAEQLGLTQSALSRSIQTFEERYGVRLFDRDRSGVRLTASGRQAFADAEALLRQAEHLVRRLSAPEDGARGRVAFGFTPAAAAALLPGLTPPLIRDCPELIMRAEVQNVDALLEQLDAGTIELVVGGEGGVPQDAAVDAQFLKQVRLAFLVRPGHPLAGHEAVTLEMLREYPFVAGRWGSIVPVTGPSADQSPMLICDDYLTLLATTLQSDAIWPGPAVGWLHDLARGRLVELKYGLEAPPAMRLVVLTAKSRTLTAQAQFVIDRLRSLASEDGGLAASSPDAL